MQSDLIIDFPKIEESKIKTHITLGTYQLQQARHYFEEHLNEGKLEIRVYKKVMIMSFQKYFGVIKSRHSNSIKYRFYCKYIPNTNTLHLVESWYCTCKTGMRTVVCFSHVAAIILFCAYTMYLPKIPNRISKLLLIFPKR